MDYISKLKSYILKAQNQIIKFMVVGSSSALIDISLLFLLTEKVHLYPVLAVAINQILIIIYNFLLNKYWSFQTKQRPIKQFSRYIVLVAFNYFASVLLMYLLYDVIGINYMLVRVLSIGLLFVFNFVVYKHWVYKEI